MPLGFFDSLRVEESKLRITVACCPAVLNDGQLTSAKLDRTATLKPVASETSKGTMSIEVMVIAVLACRLPILMLSSVYAYLVVLAYTKECASRIIQSGRNGAKEVIFSKSGKLQAAHQSVSRVSVCCQPNCSHSLIIIDDLLTCVSSSRRCLNVIVRNHSI